MTQQHLAKTLHAVNILMSAPAMKSLSLADMITAAFTLGSFSFGSARVAVQAKQIPVCASQLPFLHSA